MWGQLNDDGRACFGNRFDSYEAFQFFYPDLGDPLKVIAVGSKDEGDRWFRFAFWTAKDNKTTDLIMRDRYVALVKDGEAIQDLVELKSEFRRDFHQFATVIRETRSALRESVRGKSVYEYVEFLSTGISLGWEDPFLGRLRQIKETRGYDRPTIESFFM